MQIGGIRSRAWLIKNLVSGGSTLMSVFRLCCAILLACTLTPGAEKRRNQYQFGKIAIPPASTQEPQLKQFSLGLAITYVEEATVAWTRKNSCVSCHTNGSYMIVRPWLARYVGKPQQELHDFFVSSLHQQLAAGPENLQADIAPAQVVYVAAGLAAWDAAIGKELSQETESALTLMFKLQRPDGTWNSNDCWPPFESSAFQLATVAAMAAGTAPGWLNRPKDQILNVGLDRLKRYLREAHPLQGDYDRTALLWASSDFPGLLDSKPRQELIDMVWRHQRSDGGWSIRTFAAPEQWGKGNRAAKLRSEPEFADPPSDGHMTGLAIIALRGAGVPASDARLQRGISWLLHNQRASGRWWTRSLNSDEWHFITYSGTLYPLAALALCGQLQSTEDSHGNFLIGSSSGARASAMQNRVLLEK
jgi:squalene-hopene/tetraprenyl-beta-curcumene cyclase